MTLLDEQSRESKRRSLTSVEREHRRIEEALRVSEARYRTLIEYQTDLICRFLPDTTLTFVNNVYCNYFGMSPEELVGRRFIDFIPEEERDDTIAQVRSLDRENPVRMYEHHVVDSNGEMRWQQWTDRAIFDEYGEIIEFQSTGRDITEQKRMEEALRKSEARFRAVWETAVDAMVVTDAEGRVHVANDAYCRLFGYAADEVFGRPFWIIFPEELREQAEVGYKEVFHGPEETFRIETMVMRADGEQRFVASSANFLVENGERVGMLSVLRDITDRKQTEKAMQLANESLVQRLDELAILSQISQVISTVAYVPSALEVVGKVVIDLFKASKLTISLLDQDRPRLMVLTHIERTPEGNTEVVDSLSGRIRLLENDAVARRVIQEGRAVVSATWDQGPGTMADSSRAAHLPTTGQGLGGEEDERGADKGGEGTHCLLMVPLQASGNVVGLVAISRSDRRESFSGHEVELAQTISSSIASAIKTARLLSQEQQHRSVAESLREVVASLASSLDQETVIQAIFEQLRRIVPHTGASLCLKKRKALVVVEATGSEANSVGRKLPLAGDEPAQRVYKSRQPQMVSDGVNKDGDLREGMVSVRSWMWAPLAIENRGLGVLAVNNQGPVGYTEEDLSNFRELAHYAAIAIDNARRYEEAHALAADEERKRLARELHDSVTQALFSASLIADVLPQLFEVDPAEAHGALGTLGTLTHGALAEMRSLLLELRPADLLNARLDSVIAQLGMATTVRMPMEVSTRLDPAPRLPQKVQVAFYRITQEALNNIIKHARAGKVAISLQTTPPVTAANGDSWSGSMALTIVDDGVGFDARNNARKKSDGQMGLASMSERARAINATLRIESGPGSGTKVALNWEGAAKMKERTYQP